MSRTLYRLKCQRKIPDGWIYTAQGVYNFHGLAQYFQSELNDQELEISLIPLNDMETHYTKYHQNVVYLKISKGNLYQLNRNYQQENFLNENLYLPIGFSEVLELINELNKD